MTYSIAQHISEGCIGTAWFAQLTKIISLVGDLVRDTFEFPFPCFNELSLCSSNQKLHSTTTNVLDSWKIKTTTVVVCMLRPLIPLHVNSEWHEWLWKPSLQFVIAPPLTRHLLSPEVAPVFSYSCCSNVSSHGYQSACQACVEILVSLWGKGTWHLLLNRTLCESRLLSLLLYIGKDYLISVNVLFQSGSSYP